MTKIKKGDTVKILTGRDIDKTGLVEAVFPKKHKLIVAGMNLIVKHLKKSTKNPAGAIRKISAPLAISNVMLLCPLCKRPTRLNIKRVANKRYRICKQCHKSIDQK